MRTTLTSLLVLALPLASASSDFSFAVPATAGPEISGDGSEWLFLVVDDQSSLQSSLGIAGPIARETHSETDATIHDPILDGLGPQMLPGTMESTSGFDLFASMTTRGFSSLYVEAEDVEWQAVDAAGSISSRQEGQCLSSGVDYLKDSDRVARLEKLCPPGAINLLTSAARDAMGLTFNVTGIRMLEFHNWNLSCSQYALCPEGGEDRAMTYQGSGGVGVEMRQFKFHRFTGHGSLEGFGTARLALAGGSNMDVQIVGDARFPMASFGPSCNNCTRLQGETLQANGVMSLEGLTASGRDRMTAKFLANLETARIDEQAVDPSVLTGSTGIAATVATVGLLAVLKWLVAPFFTRLSKEKALEHPRRKVIFDYIQQHPGANFREIARNTGIAAGTVRHHLNVLGRSDIIVEHQHNSTVRLFENQVKFQQNWADLVLLREPPLGQLHAWLKEHPASPQKKVLEGMEPQGWSRSTTQHRLARLVEGGLATIRLQGRLKIYSVVDRPSSPVAPKPVAQSIPMPDVPAKPGFNTA